MSQRWFVVAALTFGVLTAAFLACLLTGFPGGPASVALDDYICAVVPLLAGACCLHRCRAAGHRSRRGWLLLGLACLSWGTGGVIWTLYEVHLGRAAPWPSVADVAYLLFAPLALAGLLLMTTAAGRPRDGWRTVMDGALAAAALLFLSWASVLGPVFRDGGETPLVQAIALAYPLSDILLATLALLAVSRARGRHRTVLTLIGLGLLSVAASDAVFAWLAARGDYATGNPADAGWVAGFALLALAALHPRSAAQVDVSARQPGRVALALPYLPVLGGGVVAIVLHVTGQSFGSFLFWNSLAGVALVLGRQLISLNVNLALSRQLQDTVRALQERESELRHHAFHDILTGLPNRASFTERVNAALAAEPPEPVVVMVLDLDGFKQVNDTHGHHAGDCLLREVASRLAGVIRPDDMVARFGGDEFAVLLRDDAATLAAAVSARIRQLLAEPIELGDSHAVVPASVGWARAGPGATLEDLLRDADRAMYRQKAAARERSGSPSPENVPPQATSHAVPG